MGSANGRHGHIPGLYQLLGQEQIPDGLFLLSGPAGAGKTMYCRQFLNDGMKNGDYCLLINSSLTENQFRQLFDMASPSRSKNLSFTNPCHSSSTKAIASKMSASLKEIRNLIDKARNSHEKRRSVRVVVDSLTHVKLVAGEKVVLKFMTDMSRIVNDAPATTICTLANADQQLQSYLSTLARGMLEMKLEDSKESIERSIRLLSIKGVPHQPVWTRFDINKGGELTFGDPYVAEAQTCTLCGRAIMGKPLTELDFVFDSKTCLETYRKLSGAFGSAITETGLPSEAFNVSFFFIDIVGLSDPLLSVKKQVQKIETLNKLISSCDAFKKTLKDKRIVLPTGDGMAIGFLQNPSLPLELSMQLHGKLREYNRGKTEEDQVGVRIGLGSGPVFTVTDINNIQNVWGPGIILARRVMDAGDNGHILLAGNLAQELIALKDEYRPIIKPLSQGYEIKHGQKITLYSVYSKDFGNPDIPFKVMR